MASFLFCGCLVDGQRLEQNEKRSREWSALFVDFTPPESIPVYHYGV
ncbi:MAG: hypothetical protein NTU87_05040 [Verrucomicrobia bacterium]|nr:hypothetical protein [Verrucomicrobiota bacterium]